MATVQLSSFNGSVGGDGRDSSSGRGASSSVSSSSLKRADQSVESPSMLESFGGDWVINGVSLFLLQGGIEVDTARAEPTNGWPVIGEYGWASHDVGSYETEYKTHEDLLDWVNNSFVAWDKEDARLIRLGVSCPNERVFHGKESNPEDFFFLYILIYSIKCSSGFLSPPSKRSYCEG